MIAASPRLSRCAATALGVLAAIGATVTQAPRPAQAAPASSGGVVLDGFGGLHPFGGLALDTQGAEHWSSDVARSVSVLPDGSGGWTLDGEGGVHPFGAAAPLSGTPTWAGWDIARAILVLPGQTAGYVLDGFGGIHPFGGAPVLSGAPYWFGEDVARGLDVHLDGSGSPDGGAVLDATGQIHTFGNYPTPLHPTVYAGRNLFVALHNAGGVVYAVGRFGTVMQESTGAALDPAWSGYSDAGQDDVIRDVFLTSPAGGSGGAQPMSVMARYAWAGATGPRGGVTLDGFGGLHPFGGLALNRARAPYWPGWDIARSLALTADSGGGWILDGEGGVHAFGDAAHLSGTPYWPGWDIARSLVVNPVGRSGYVLDGMGGVHAFGGAPHLTGAPYWSGKDLARGLAVHYAPDGVPDGGWVLDAWGGEHAFGAAGALGGVSWWPGRDVYLHVHTTYDGRAYDIARWGGFDDVSGGMSPYWSGYADFGAWDILRDVVLVGADDATPAAQPQSGAANGAWWDHVWVYAFNVAPVQQGLPLDCESAALEEATRALGRDVSQYSIFDTLPNVDRGPAQMSNGRVVRWGDPYTEFVGNVYGCEPCGTGYGVYDPPLVTVAQHFGFAATGIENGAPGTLFTDVAQGHPVLVITSDTFTPVSTYWWTGYDGRAVPYSFYDHAVTVVAVNGVAGTVTINDVADGRMKTFTMSQFAAFWTAYLDMAVVLQ